MLTIFYQVDNVDLTRPVKNQTYKQIARRLP